MSLTGPTETMLDGFRPVLRSDNLARHYDNEVVAWSSASALPVFLDPIAAVVFQIIDGVATVADLINDVHAELGLAREVADLQIRKCLHLLDAGGLLATSTSTPASATDDLFAEPPST